MKYKKIFLFVAVIAIFGVCLSIMNKRFDRLSRYPYENPQARELINKYMSDEEIEFIIEYSIDPSYFIDYIDCCGFNVYHVDAYDEAKGYCWYLSNGNIVDLVEKIYAKSDANMINDTLRLLSKYNYEEVIYFLEKGDEYGGSSMLYENPEDKHIVFNADTCIGIHNPYDIIIGMNYSLKDEAYENFDKVIEEVNKEFKCSDFGGIEILSSYLSYKELEEIHKSIPQVIPGHNEHQTGLAIDINIKDSIFNENSNYVKFKEILSHYGFRISKCDLSEYHLRYNPEFVS